MSIDNLIKNISGKNNPSVVGLDTHLSYIPSFIKEESFARFGKGLKAAGDTIFKFNKALIDGLHDIIPAVKPQSAYYELYGWEGVRALRRTISYARKCGLYVIVDVKRNDIGSTASAYAGAYLGSVDIDGTAAAPFNADSVTVNPYLGIDGIEPFIEKCNKFDRSIFVLVKTSNKSSGELQDVATEDGGVYMTAAKLVGEWGKLSMGKSGYSNVGAVVGATYPAQAEIIRKALPNTFFLVPGYGAQGGGADDVVPCFNPNGLGAIVNSSRGIMCAYQKNGASERDFVKAARDEAIRMRDEINKKIK